MRSSLSSYLSNADGIILAYNAKNSDSFLKIKNKWLPVITFHQANLKPLMFLETNN